MRTPSGPPDVTEPIDVFELDHFTDELRPARAEPGQDYADLSQARTTGECDVGDAAGGARRLDVEALLQAL